MTVTHNSTASAARTKQVHKNFVSGTRRAANRGGRHIRDNIRGQLPPGGGRSAGNFEGYAATGRLRRNVVATDPKQRGRAGDWITTVLVRADSVTDKYARIHRDGGTIRAKNAPYLTFKVRGRWVRTKQVRIRRKNYMADGVRAAQRDLPSVIKNEILREVR